MADPMPAAARDSNFAQKGATITPNCGDFAAEPSLFRFRIRHLLFLVTAVSLLLAGLVTLDGLSAIALLLAAFVLAFHVFGNALGSRLRLQADRNGFEPESEQVLSRSRHFTRVDPAPAPIGQVVPPPWYGQDCAPVPWIPRLTAMAVFIGGCVGTLVLMTTVGHRTSAAGLAVGAVSLAAISGLLAFLGGNLYANVRRGLREALDEERREAPRKP